MIPLWINPRLNLAGLKWGYSSVDLIHIKKEVDISWKENWKEVKLRDMYVPKLFPHFIESFMDRINT